MVWDTTQGVINPSHPTPSEPAFVLFDGHHRYEICQKNRVDFQIDLMSFPSIDEVKDFMIDSLKKHISLGLDTSKVVVLGKKNAGFIEKLNREEHLFGQIAVLEHPRFIQQYKSKEKQQYIERYISTLNNLDPD